MPAHHRIPRRRQGNAHSPSHRLNGPEPRRAGRTSRGGNVGVLPYRQLDAFSGPGADGKPVCGIGSTNPVDNRSFSLRFAIGGDSVAFQAKKPNWSIPAGAQLPVVVQIGLDTPWNLQGTGNGQVVEWSLDRIAVQTFDAVPPRRYHDVSFPSGNEPPWTVGLNGSIAISNGLAAA